MDNLKNKIKKTIPFIIALKKIKYLGLNLTKEIENMHSEKLQNNVERNY